MGRTQGAGAYQAAQQGGKGYWNSALTTPVTIERLEKAVRHMDAVEVSHALQAGIDVNQPIDAVGHTVLDVFAREQQKLMSDTLELNARQDQKTKLFYQAEAAAFETLQVLHAHGAKMSSHKDMKNRPKYI